jgi:hypothetical protein
VLELEFVLVDTVDMQCTVVVCALSIASWLCEFIHDWNVQTRVSIIYGNWKSGATHLFTTAATVTNTMDSVRHLDASSESCVTVFNNEVQLYNTIVGISLGVTFLVVILYFVVLRPRISESPGLVSRFYAMASVVKLTLAILIIAVFVPKCPSGCSCEDSAHFYVYPVVAALVSFSWWKRSRLLGQQQEQLPVAVAVADASETEFRDNEPRGKETEMV